LFWVAHTWASLMYNLFLLASLKKLTKIVPTSVLNFWKSRRSEGKGEVEANVKGKGRRRGKEGEDKVKGDEKVR
jgi:hypothetical protein